MPESPVENAWTTVWVNARFLDRPTTGVERVARELLDALARNYLDDSGGWRAGNRRFRLRLIAPRSTTSHSPWPNIDLHRAGAFDGHAWEQFDLPRLTRGELLASLCNTGPLFKRKHVLFLHDAQPFVIPDNFSRAFRLWYRFLFRIGGRIATRILVNSRFTRGELRRHAGLPPRKMMLCYPGSEHVERPLSDQAGPRSQALPEEPFLLAVASANPNKNFCAVVNALEALGDLAPPCVIVGCKDQRQFAGVKIDPDRVTHLGYVTDDELLALYRRALCLVFPSYYEGFGLPPLEAMASGCPVISSRTSAMPEISGTAAEYCDPDDHQTLMRAILRVISSPERRRTMRERGLRRAGRFSWHSSAGRLLKMLSATA